MLNKTLVMMTFMMIISLGITSAHNYGFDTSLRGYFLNYNVTLESSGNYTVNATFTFCRQGTGALTGAEFLYQHGIPPYWCAGNISDCCPAGINALTGECNSGYIKLSGQKSCKNFGVTSPVLNCFSVLKSSYSEYYNRLHGSGGYLRSDEQPELVQNHPLCQNYLKKDAWVSSRTFTTTSLDDYIIAAGFSLRGSDDDFHAVPIYKAISNENEPEIECENDADCNGEMCDVSDLSFCQNSDLKSVFRNFKVPKCINAGMADSHCELENVPKAVGICEYRCDDGRCVG